MTKAIRIGQLFGINIEIDYTWFIIFFLVAAALSTGLFAQSLPDLSLPVRWAVAGMATVLFFASVLLHELSHSVMALRAGLSITGITLFIFGGVSKMSEEPKSASDELKIAIAGPLMSLVLAGLFLGLAQVVRSLWAGEVFSTVFTWLGWVNGVLAVFNMLPGFPLDGGRVLRAGIWKWSTNLAEATRIAATFGQGIGIMMIVGGLFLFFAGAGIGSLWLALIGWFLMQASQASYRQLILRQALGGVTVGQVMTKDVDSVPAEMTLDEVVQDYVMGRNHPAFPVVADDQVLGLLCLNEIRGVPREQWGQVTAREAASPLTKENSISPSTDAWDAVVRMSQENCGRLVVTEDRALRGIVSRTDIMRLMRTRLELGV